MGLYIARKTGQSISVDGNLLTIVALDNSDPKNRKVQFSSSDNFYGISDSFRFHGAEIVVKSIRPSRINLEIKAKGIPVRQL